MSSQRIHAGILCVLLALMLPPARAEPIADGQHPLVVNSHSRVAVMEYEAWFGPMGVTFQDSTAKPLLSSADMVPFGGGYDSADPAVIQQHVKWFKSMGIDAALVDLSNDVSCIFNSEWFVKKYLQNFNSCPTLRSDYQSIRDNTGNLYPAWSALQTSLKIIPLLGGIDQNELYLDLDGKTAFEKEIEYFGGLMAMYPQLSVIYEGKPLMIVYLAAAQDPDVGDNPLWYQFRQFLVMHPKIASQYTFRQMAGYIDSQPGLWQDPSPAAGPRAVAPEYGFWSWVDRLKTACTASECPYYPSFNRQGDRVENFSAAIATAGQAGWGCPNPDSKPYCEDDALRWNQEHQYATFDSFMVYARELDPIFLILHQFNEFVPPDEGFDANTNDEIEPSNLWGKTALAAVTTEVERYHFGGCSTVRRAPFKDDSPCRTSTANSSVPTQSHDAFGRASSVAAFSSLPSSERVESSGSSDVSRHSAPIRARLDLSQSFP